MPRILSFGALACLAVVAACAGTREPADAGAVAGYPRTLFEAEREEETGRSLTAPGLWRENYSGGDFVAGRLR